MSEVSPDQLKQVVESRHGGTATFLQLVPLHEEYAGQVVWDGTVAVFELDAHPDGAFRAYAWSREVAGSGRRFFTVLHGGQITGPRQAVMAAIVGEARASQNR